MTQKRYVFGYGSILNPASMAKDVDPKNFVGWTTLAGYERIFNAPVNGSLALNLRQHPEKTVEGVLLLADEEVMAALEGREKGYRAVDVTEKCAGADGTVLVFLAPQGRYPDLSISKEYIDECTAGVPRSMRDQWLNDSIIENPVV